MQITILEIFWPKIQEFITGIVDTIAKRKLELTSCNIVI